MEQRGKVKRKKAAGRAYYANHRLRNWLKRKRIRAFVPKGGCEKKHPKSFDKALYKERNRVERLFCRLKQHRRIATR